VTETPSTVTIAAAGGLTPIAVSNPGGAKLKARGNAMGGSRKSSPAPVKHPKQVAFSIKDGHFECSPTQYPSKVACKKDIEIVSTRTTTYTARQTITKHVEAPAVTQKVTVTYFSTTTTMPIDASTTLTILSTSTLTSTSISTSLTTVIATAVS
jgi:hypothetical protein